MISQTPETQLPDGVTNAPSTATIPSTESGSQVDIVDLSAFVSAWNTHDPSVIRALYTEDARYFTGDDLRKFQQEEKTNALVTNETFAEYIHRFDQFKMRILGEPIGIFGKLVAFAYRQENEGTGFNGVMLLRYEEGKILLNVDVISSKQTLTQPDDSSQMTEIDLGNLMQAWNNADVTAAQNLYSDTAIILSDEDLIQAPWRDFVHPPQLKNLLTQFADWDPITISKAMRLEDMTVFAWRWKSRSYPAGYGVRLLQYNDSKIVTDIRFAIRPWEGNGNHFLNP
jgi:ketosteroid isomerase-like protein